MCLESLESLQLKTRQKVNELELKASRMWGVEVGCFITYDLNSAGVLGRYKVSDNAIDLNPKLLEEYGDAYINEVVIHEFAHAVVAKMMIKGIVSLRAKPHGKEFKSVCREFGIKGTARTDLFDDSKHLNKNKFSYTCDCGYDHKVSKIIHGKIQRGQHRICSLCKSRLVLRG